MAVGMTESEGDLRRAFQRQLSKWGSLLGLVTLITVWGVVLYRSVFVNMVWEDEAFNLTVVRNAAGGLGYASDGALSANVLAPFDARISTGPVVLLPAILLHRCGVDLVLSGRLVAAAFAVMLAVGLYLIGARLQCGPGASAHHRRVSWVGLVVAAAPLTYNTWLTISPIQGPADVLGEFAAAACVVWAMLFVWNRPWLAGLLLGLAVQCKFIALLAVPAFVVAGLLRRSDAGFWRRIRGLIVPGCMVVVPTVLYELWVLVELGAHGYRQHLHEFRLFLEGGYQEHNTLRQKADLYLHAWFLPATTIVIAILFFVVLTAIILWRRGTFAHLFLGARQQIAVIAVLGLGTYLAWWGTSSTTPLWVRHPAVGVLSFVPVLIGACLVLLREGVPTEDRAAGAQWNRVAGRLLASGVVLLVMIQLGGYLQGILGPRIMTLDAQRAEAQQIKNVTALEAGDSASQGLAAQWGRPISTAVLTDERIANLDGPIGSTDHLPRVLFRDRLDLCGAEPLLATDHFLVCRASSDR